MLIAETAIATGARISGILGLRWQHIDLKDGVIHIVQRNWRGDIDDPKSKTSKRPLTLGNLAERYRVQANADKAQPDKCCTPSSTPFAPMSQSPPTGPLHALHLSQSPTHAVFAVPQTGPLYRRAPFEL